MEIRVITPVVPTGMTQASDFAGILDGDDKLSYVEIETGPASIETELDKALAAPEVVARVVEAEADGVTAAVIDCMCDPGLYAARECASIPVLGPCETAMNVACMLGQRYSVLSVSQSMAGIFERQAKTYGAWEKYGSTRAIDVPVLDLGARAEEVAGAILVQARAALETDRADVLIVGCTGMVGVARSLQEQLLAAGTDVPVIDPVPLAVRMARTLVLSGLGPSKSDYPRPGRKEIRGYDLPGLSPFKA